MIKSNLKVEQINENIEIVMDYGEILSKSETADIILKNFPDTKYKNGCIYGEKDGKQYCVYFKNISY